MASVGHFPMSENPEAFFAYLEPVLDRIRADAIDGQTGATAGVAQTEVSSR